MQPSSRSTGAMQKIFCQAVDAVSVEDTSAALACLGRTLHPVAVFLHNGKPFIGNEFKLDAQENAHPLLGTLPEVQFNALGDISFCRDYRISLPYVSGSMANGIASVRLVIAMAKAGCLGFFGAAGLSLEKIENALLELQHELGDLPFGINLIHSPNEPKHEAATVDLFLQHGIRLIEASAFLDVTLPLVKYRLAGISRDRHGKIVTPNRILGKVSRIEIGSKFFAPPPTRLVQELLQLGQISSEQAELAKHIPLCQDITAEADSGGHTDNRPALALLPILLALRDRAQQQFSTEIPLRVGLGGGVSTPAAVLAAFSMGAAYVMTGSINQACIESGSSDIVRQMLADAGQADVAMAPAADMFEMGVKVQVLKRGTMFAMRATKLYELYRNYPSLQSIPKDEIHSVEKQILQSTVEEVWAETKTYFSTRDPEQIHRAESDPKHQMALVFRWYLGQSSRWANSGIPNRRLDYQVWCGPAMGAFNEWVRDSHLQAAHHRSAALVAGNLLVGAAIMGRVQQLKNLGLNVANLLGRMPRPFSATELHDRIRLQPVG